MIERAVVQTTKATLATTVMETAVAVEAAAVAAATAAAAAAEAALGGVAHTPLGGKMRMQCAKFASGRSGPNGDHRRRMSKWNRCRDPPSGVRHHLEPRVVLRGFAVVLLWSVVCGGFAVV